MSRTIVLAIASSLLIVSLLAHANGALVVPPALGLGVVVEEVAPETDAQRAGLQKGDIILSWSREEHGGKIETPFDLLRIRIEEAPLGKVTLEGLRGGKKHAWVLGPSYWNLAVRPPFSGALLIAYQEGQALAKAGKLRQAVAKWRAAAMQAEASQSRWLASWLLLRIGHLLAANRRWAAADAACHEALTRASGGPLSVKELLLQDCADAFSGEDDSVHMGRYLEKALVVGNNAGRESLSIAKSMEMLGLIAGRQSDWPKAEGYCRQASVIAEKLAPDSLAVASTLDCFAMTYAVRSRWAEAEQYYRQSLAIRRKVDPDSLDLAQTLVNLGRMAALRLDLANADVYLTQAVSIQEKLVPGSLILANTLKDSALVPLQAGDPTAAEERLKQALAIQEKLAPGSSDLAESLSYRSKALMERGDLAAAEGSARRALAIRKKLAPGGQEVALSLADLGEILRLRDDLARAAKYYSKALEIIIRIGPGSIWASTTLGSLAEITQEQGDLVKAEFYAKRALAITDKTSPASYVAAWNKGLLGRIVLSHGHYLEAKELFLKAHDIYRQSTRDPWSESSSNYDLGDVARAQGDWAEAEKRYRESLNAFEKLDTRYLERAEAMAALAGILRRTDRVEEAGKLYQQSLEIVERFASNLGGAELVRSHFRAKRAAHYHEYIDLLVGQKDFEQAFHVLERWRARTLLETLGAGHVQIDRGADPSLLRQERGLREAIAAKANLRLQRGEGTSQEAAFVDKEIRELLAKYEDVEAQVGNSGSNYAALTQPQTLTVKQVQQHLLDDGTALLEYSLGEERSYIFAVTRSSFQVYQLPKRIEVEKLARRAYDLIAIRKGVVSPRTRARAQRSLTGTGTNYLTAASELSRMILGPVAGDIQGKRLLIVNDGALQYIPFGALPDPEEPSAPLMANHEIVSLPSASVLAEIRQANQGRPMPQKEVAVLADPVFAQNDVRVVGVAGRNPSRAPLATARTVKDEQYSQESAVADSAALLTRSAADLGLLRRAGPYLPRLPFSRREAKAILSVTPKGQAMEALDFRASRATAVSPDLSQYRVLHFATHALLNSEHPELSGLVFSLVDPQGRPQSGFLGLEDIYNLNLSADLVVLSACETALGKEIQGEGLVGLTRGFMYAGASQVVASLWSVDDEATAELMRLFYKAMEQDGLRPAAALRRAQMEIRKQQRWSQPYYWAGFVIQGEWR